MSNETNTLLEVRHLKKYFATKAGPLCAVDDVSFEIARGQTLGLVGESGCGKSTTGRAILRLHEPTAGEVVFEGEDIVGYNRSRMKTMRKEMQIVFQDPYSCLNPRMDVKSLIEDSLKVSGNGESRKEREEKVYEAMGLVGLEKRLASSYPHELDGGRRQRIGIARALILQPKFIVMDEPVSALDVCVQAQILHLMLELQEKLGLTYLFISHNLSVVKHVSDNIAVMYLGKIVEVASYKDIFLSPRHPYTKALLSAIPIPKAHLNRERIILEGDITSPVNPPPGCRFASRCWKCKDICKEQCPELRKVGNSIVACHFAEED